MSSQTQVLSVIDKLNSKKQKQANSFNLMTQHQNIHKTYVKESGTGGQFQLASAIAKRKRLFIAPKSNKSFVEESLKQQQPLFFPHTSNPDHKQYLQEESLEQDFLQPDVLLENGTTRHKGEEKPNGEVESRNNVVARGIFSYQRPRTNSPFPHMRQKQSRGKNLHLQEQTNRESSFERSGNISDVSQVSKFQCIHASENECFTDVFTREQSIQQSSGSRERTLNLQQNALIKGNCVQPPLIFSRQPLNKINLQENVRQDSPVRTQYDGVSRNKTPVIMKKSMQSNQIQIDNSQVPMIFSPQSINFAQNKNKNKQPHSQGQRQITHNKSQSEYTQASSTIKQHPNYSSQLLNQDQHSNSIFETPTGAGVEDFQLLSPQSMSRHLMDGNQTSNQFQSQFSSQISIRNHPFDHHSYGGGQLSAGHPQTGSNPRRRAAALRAQGLLDAQMTSNQVDLQFFVPLVGTYNQININRLKSQHSNMTRQKFLLEPIKENFTQLSQNSKTRNLSRDLFAPTVKFSSFQYSHQQAPLGLNDLDIFEKPDQVNLTQVSDMQNFRVETNKAKPQIMKFNQIKDIFTTPQKKISLLQSKGPQSTSLFQKINLPKPTLIEHEALADPTNQFKPRLAKDDQYFFTFHNPKSQRGSENQFELLEDGPLQTSEQYDHDYSNQKDQVKLVEEIAARMISLPNRVSQTCNKKRNGYKTRQEGEGESYQFIPGLNQVKHVPRELQSFI